MSTAPASGQAGGGERVVHQELVALLGIAERVDATGAAIDAGAGHAV